ncbi:MAG: hypothetical protein JNM56_38955 [Planctomycetia bacterium]|nr:hypothetical protein [Planctomycetia bacterium]
MRLSLSLCLLGSLLAAGCGSSGTGTTKTTTTGDAKPSEKAGMKGGTIELAGGADLLVPKGKSVKFMLNANRRESKVELIYQGDIKLEFDTSDVPGLTIAPAVIEAGKDGVEVTATATADAAPGAGFVAVTASGDGVKPEEKMRLRATIK